MNKINKIEKFVKKSEKNMHSIKIDYKIDLLFLTIIITNTKNYI